MECPNVVMALWFLLSPGSKEACRRSAVNLALLGMFVLHYTNRWERWLVVCVSCVSRIPAFLGVGISLSFSLFLSLGFHHTPIGR